MLRRPYFIYNFIQFPVSYICHTYSKVIVATERRVEIKDPQECAVYLYTQRKVHTLNTVVIKKDHHV